VQKASESKKLLQVLSEQVLDEKLQLSKKWFACFSQQSDLSTLQRLLCQRWREMNVEEIQSEFQITLEEEDLFYSYR
jgi:copper oxidase (laccase) domain-containing protein